MVSGEWLMLESPGAMVWWFRLEIREYRVEMGDGFVVQPLFLLSLLYTLFSLL
jgi:hypothetical protein